MLIFGMLAVPVRSLAYTDWFMLAYLGSVFAVAIVVFRWVERPVQNWLRGLGRPRSASR
jgi:peptidoglycan/LPS O-acetylase OafA/YrhL